MLNRHARGFFTALFSPLARWLLKIGVSPDAITIVGHGRRGGGRPGVLSAGPAVVGNPLHHGLHLLGCPGRHHGAPAGTSAAAGATSWTPPWTGLPTAPCSRALPSGSSPGARTARSPSPPSSALSLAWWFPTRGPRPSPSGFQANVGIAERAERLVSVLVVTGFTGLGLPQRGAAGDADPARRRQPGHGRPADRHRAPAVTAGAERHGLAAACLIGSGPHAASEAPGQAPGPQGNPFQQRRGVGLVLAVPGQWIR